MYVDRMKYILKQDVDVDHSIIRSMEYVGSVKVEPSTMFSLAGVHVLITINGTIS